ncbi:hypothetical protein ACULX1_001892 [Escherichia coli]
MSMVKIAVLAAAFVIGVIYITASFYVAVFITELIVALLGVSYEGLQEYCKCRFLRYLFPVYDCVLRRTCGGD